MLVISQLESGLHFLEGIKIARLIIESSINLQEKIFEITSKFLISASKKNFIDLIWSCQRLYSKILDEIVKNPVKIKIVKTSVFTISIETSNLTICSLILVNENVDTLNDGFEIVLNKSSLSTLQDLKPEIVIIKTLWMKDPEDVKNDLRTPIASIAIYFNGQKQSSKTSVSVFILKLRHNYDEEEISDKNIQCVHYNNLTVGTCVTKKTNEEVICFCDPDDYYGYMPLEVSSSKYSALIFILGIKLIYYCLLYLWGHQYFTIEKSDTRIIKRVKVLSYCLYDIIENLLFQCTRHFRKN